MEAVLGGSCPVSVTPASAPATATVFTPRPAEQLVLEWGLLS